VEYGTTTAYGSTTTIDTSLVTSHTVILGELTPDTTYHYRVKSKDTSDNEGVSSADTFSTAALVKPKQPTNLSPADGTIDIVLAPGLLCSAFSDPDMGDSHYASRWQIASDDLFASIVYDSSIDTSNLTSISIPPGMLTYGTPTTGVSGIKTASGTGRSGRAIPTSRR